MTALAALIVYRAARQNRSVESLRPSWGPRTLYRRTVWRADYFARTFSPSFLPIKSNGHRNLRDSHTSSQSTSARIVVRPRPAHVRVQAACSGIERESSRRSTSSEYSRRKSPDEPRCREGRRRREPLPLQNRWSNRLAGAVAVLGAVLEVVTPGRVNLVKSAKTTSGAVSRKPGNRS